MFALTVFQPVLAVKALTEASIRAHLKVMEEGSLSDSEKQTLTLDSYMQFATANGLQRLQSSIAAAQAELHFTLGNLRQAETAIEQHIDYAQSNKQSKVLFSFYYLQSKIAGRRSNHVKALQIADKMLLIAELLKNDSKVADSYILFGQLLTRINRLEDALSYLQKALILYEIEGDGLGVSVTNSSIASLYVSLNEQVKAIEYYEQALVYLRTTGERFNESIVLFNIGLAHRVLEDNVKAKQLFEQSMQISVDLKDDLGIAYTKTQLAKIESDEGEKNKAILHLKQALPIFERSNEQRMIFITSLALATNYSDIGQHSLAEDIHQTLLEFAKSLNNLDFEIMYYRSLGEINANTGDYKKAYNATKPYVELLQKQHKAEKDKSITEMRVKFDTEKKEKENKLLLQENQLKQLKLDEEERLNVVSYLFMAIIGVVVIVISALLFKQIQLRKMYRHMAMRDELTGAFNRRAIMAFAKNRVDESRAMQSRLTIALLDLDWFKKFNDQYGHDIGDEVLKAFAKAALSAIRSNDRVGRFGGEEWLYVLPDTENNSIPVIFARIKSQLSNVKIEGLPSSHKITFSMGVASLSKRHKKLEDLIKEADEKLYLAKENGRDQYVI